MKQKNLKKIKSNNIKKKDGGIMKLQEAISAAFALLGVYFLLIFAGIFLYPPNLEAIIGTNLVWSSLFSFLASYLISPYLWEKIFRR